MAQDKDFFVRIEAANFLESAFNQVPDKDQAWQDLHMLTQDEYSFVRLSATDALGSAFSQVPDPDQAWQDLVRLTQDEFIDVRKRAANALGSAFSHISDKDQAWQDLIKLTQDKDGSVRMYAYHSLGRASVFKATESEDQNTLKCELEAAVDYFEMSSQESQFSPARFCYPFYRTYYAITFQGARKMRLKNTLQKQKKL